MDRNDLHITKLGADHLGIYGMDDYILVRSRADDIDLAAVEDLFLQAYYREGNGPGTPFCHMVRAIPDPLHTDRCIVIVYHRYDV